MKILILGNHEVVIYNFRKELIQKLRELGYSVTLSFPEGKRVDYFRNLGCDFEPISIDRHSKNPFKDLALFFSYLGMIRRVNPDVVLTYTIKPNIWGGLAALILGKRYIANITGMGTALEKPGPFRIMTKALYRLSMVSVQRIFFQNESNLEFFSKANIGKRRYRQIPGSGVNLREFAYTPYPEQSSITRFLFIGRVKKEKGIDEYLAAAEHIMAERNDVEFGILGFFDGDYESIVLEKQRKGIVKYYGFIDDIRPLVEQSHAVVLPSYSEGMANVLLEAAAMGRPVVATRIPGCEATYKEDVTGFGCDVGSADSLRESLRSFLDLSHYERANFGRAGRKHVEEEFDRNIVISAYLAELGLE